MYSLEDSQHNPKNQAYQILIKPKIIL